MEKNIASNSLISIDLYCLYLVDGSNQVVVSVIRYIFIS